MSTRWPPAVIATGRTKKKPPRPKRPGRLNGKLSECLVLPLQFLRQRRSMSPQPASLLPPPACAVAHPVVVTLFIETDAGDQLADAQDEQRHARPAGRSSSPPVPRVAPPDRHRP